MLCTVQMTDVNHKQDMEVPELLTLSEASGLLKVHANTLRKWDKNGTLPAIRLGTKRIRRYRKEDIIKNLILEPIDLVSEATV